MNKLSVWSFPYRKTYYLTHPHRWLHDLYWNWRNFWHRAKYGYAYVDVWNFCDWYPRVGAEALRYLAKHHSGYPAVKPGETSEEWSKYLNMLANRLERCANSFDICFGAERNEYDAMLDEIMESKKVIKEQDGMTIHTHEPLTEEEEEIRKKYFERAQEIAAADQSYIETTYRWLAEDLGHMWD